MSLCQKLFLRNRKRRLLLSLSLFIQFSNPSSAFIPPSFPALFSNLLFSRSLHRLLSGTQSLFPLLLSFFPSLTMP